MVSRSISNSWLALFALVGIQIPLSSAWAKCIDVLDVRRELPYDVVTPKGKNLSYFYNLDREQYVILLSVSGEPAVTRGPFFLQRSCLPGKLRWESDRFALFESACGTFCWMGDVLSASGQTQRVFRPLEFDEERNLVLFYAEQDTISVRNLSSQREQKIRTAKACETASGLCFKDARFNENEVMYTWQDGQVFSVPLEQGVRDDPG